MAAAHPHQVKFKFKTKGGWGGGTVAAAAVAPRLRSHSPALIHTLSFINFYSPDPFNRSHSLLSFPCSHKPTRPFAFVCLPPLARSCLFRPAHPCLFPFVPVHLASVRTCLCSHALLIRACSRLRLAFVRARSRPLGCLPV